MLSGEDKEMIEDHIKAHATLGAEEIGQGRMASNIDPALAAAPTAAEGPIVPPLPPQGANTEAPGQVGLPTAANNVLEGMGSPEPTPEAASSEIMQLMQQLGG